MPAPQDAPPRDWTNGPAKWFAVGVLSTLGVGALAWSLTSGRGPPASAIAGAPVERIGTPIERISEPVPPAPQVGNALSATTEKSYKAPPATLARTININTATTAELELLPGIGPALAQRIIDERTLRGAFARVEDLDRVRGIGPKMLARLRAHVSVE